MVSSFTGLKIEQVSKIKIFEVYLVKYILKCKSNGFIEFLTPKNLQNKVLHENIRQKMTKM